MAWTRFHITGPLGSEYTGDRWILKGLIIWSFNVWFAVSLNKLSTEQSSCRWSRRHTIEVTCRSHIRYIRDPNFVITAPTDVLAPISARPSTGAVWASCQICKIAGCACAEMPGTFSPPPRVSDPDMHHGTCVTHVPWCMTGSLTSGFL